MATEKKRTPKVRIAKPRGRPLQLRYTCPVEHREIRISTNTYDEAEAAEQKADLEAKLRLGLDATPARKGVVRNEDMPWDDFREDYTRLKVDLLEGHKTAAVIEAHLDVCQRIIRPRRLGEMADPSNLATLQAELRAGKESKKGPRSPHTVRSYMITVVAALNWAHDKGWLPAPIRFKRLKVSDPSKGRPITEAEFEQMLAAVDSVCKVDPESWKFFLSGLWESGLRLGEGYNVSWDNPDAIQPIRDQGQPEVVLRIPGPTQKNGKEQKIPTTPAFVALLDSVPLEQREGWIFNPAKQRGTGRFTDMDQVGRIITAIGRKAGIVVNSKGKPASAHDLRRSFGQRMADAGVAPLDLQAIMRHADFRTTQSYYLKGDALKQSKRLADVLTCTQVQPCTQVQSEGSQQRRTTAECT